MIIGSCLVLCFIDSTSTHWDTCARVWVDYSKGFPSDELLSDCWYLTFLVCFVVLFNGFLLILDFNICSSSTGVWLLWKCIFIQNQGKFFLNKCLYFEFWIYSKLLVLIVLSVIADFECYPARTSGTSFLLYIYSACSLLGRNILPGMSWCLLIECSL